MSNTNLTGFLLVLAFITLIVSPLPCLAITAYYYVHHQPGYAIFWLILTLVLGRISFRILAYVFES